MGKLQAIIEDILKKHGIDPLSESYYLKLRMLSHDESLVIGKVGEQILAGFQNKNLISDPVFSFDYNEGLWIPVQFEQKNGIFICSFVENGNHMAFPYRLKRCMLVQAMFAKNIREQQWLENGVKVE
jgi:hypothetical protein